MLKRFSNNKNKGFSLVELIVVIAIMAIIAAVLAPSLLGYVEKSRMQKDASSMDEVVNSMKLSLADQEIYDELLQASVKNNYSCYADGSATTNINSNKVSLKSTDHWLYNDECRLLDETIYKPAGSMRGVTITFRPDGEFSYILKDGIINKMGDNNTAKGIMAGKLLSDSAFEATCNRLRSTIGDTLKVSSQTYRNSDYTIFISMGTTGGNEAIMQDAIQVWGQFNGTNLPEVTNENNVSGGSQDEILDDGLTQVENGIVGENAEYITVNGTSYGPGEQVPEPATGDTYINQHYKLMYNYSYYGSNSFSKDESIGGWSIAVKDTTLESYPDIPAYINGEPVVDLHNAFEGCANMKYSPKIPNTVLYMVDTYSECYALKECPQLPANLVDMYATFHNCTGLKDASSLIIPKTVVKFQSAFNGCTNLEKPPVLPEGIEDMMNAFYNCQKLQYMPEIPNSVTDMHQAFQSCKSLTQAKTIPVNVTRIGNLFRGCTNLSGSVTINTSTTSYSNALKGTQITEVKGNTPYKSQILATK